MLTPFLLSRSRAQTAVPRIGRALAYAAVAAAAQFAIAASVRAADAGVADPELAARFAVHGQATFVDQQSNDFRAPYSGPNSLTPRMNRETTDATLFVGARLWPGAEAWITQELDQGFGLDNTVGAAGFPSGEAYKVGQNKPYLRLQRIFLRQTIELGGVQRSVEPDSMQFGATTSANRLVFTVGKFSVTDLFDTNRYAHDPRGDFLNWTAIDAGSFDYAADAWGYTAGAAAEWYQDSWTLRAGVFDLSNVPNSIHLDPGAHEFQWVAELEKREHFRGRPGRLLITAYDSRARMGLLNSAVQLAAATGGPVDISAVRQYRSRVGASLNFEQELTSNLGVFARAGRSAGNVEVYEFTDIDRALSVGLSIKGTPWARPADTVGIAAMNNGISAARQNYLNAGGLGVLIGDGRLPHPAAERIIEAYYEAGLIAHTQVTFDFQRIQNPGYNSDRGPAQMIAVRLHAEF